MACFLNIVIFGLIGSLWASIIICATVTGAEDWLPVILFIPCLMMTVWLYSAGSLVRCQDGEQMIDHEGYVVGNRQWIQGNTE